jgi:hypothetical protein
VILEQSGGHSQSWAVIDQVGIRSSVGALKFNK